MSGKRSLYLVPKTLDAPVRVFGLPLDEFIPACLVALIFFGADKMFLAISSPVLVVSMFRVIKKGQGCSWLLNLLYWYFPKEVTRHVFRYTPPSEYREYIA